jgi:hypothetical protein
MAYVVIEGAFSMTPSHLNLVTCMVIEGVLLVLVPLHRDCLQVDVSPPNLPGYGTDPR